MGNVTFPITNAETIGPVVGQLVRSFNQGVADGVVSPNNVVGTSFAPGCILKLDPAATMPGPFQLLLAAATDVIDGMMIYDSLNNSIVTSAALPGGSPIKFVSPSGSNAIVLYHQVGAGVSFVPGADLQYNTDGTNTLIPVTTGKRIARAIDAGVAGQVVKISLISAYFTAQG